MSKKHIAFTCLGLLAGAVLISVVFVLTAPKAEKKRPPKMAALVDVKRLTPIDQTVSIKLTGTVRPAEEVLLRARVSGEVVSMDPEFIEGGMIARGDNLLTIDPVDYQLALADAESKMIKAQFDHKIELGRQDVAAREWELLKGDGATELEKELALRIPHLAASRAALNAAEAAFQKAKLNLDRTKIRSPFNAVVLDRRVNIGSQASQQDVLARLAGTDAYWVIVSIPVDRLAWVNIPGSKASVTSNSGTVRAGTVIRLMGDLEEKGRMARLLIQIEDPICLTPENQEKKPLLLGEYVRVDLEGRTLKQVYTIPRNALHEDGKVWIAASGKLDIRNVDVLWRDADQVILRNGFSEGDLLIVSDLTAPIQGMDVNTGNSKQKAPAEKD